MKKKFSLLRSVYRGRACTKFNKDPLILPGITPAVEKFVRSFFLRPEMCGVGVLSGSIPLLHLKFNLNSVETPRVGAAIGYIQTMQRTMWQFAIRMSKLNRLEENRKVEKIVSRVGNEGEIAVKLTFLVIYVVVIIFELSMKYSSVFCQYCGIVNRL